MKSMQEILLGPIYLLIPALKSLYSQGIIIRRTYITWHIQGRIQKLELEEGGGISSGATSEPACRALAHPVNDIFISEDLFLVFYFYNKIFKTCYITFKISFLPSVRCTRRVAIPFFREGAYA